MAVQPREGGCLRRACVGLLPVDTAAPPSLQLPLPLAFGSTCGTSASGTTGLTSPSLRENANRVSFATHV